VLITTLLLAGFGAVLLGTGIAAAGFIAEHAPAGCPAPGASCAAFDDVLDARYGFLVTALGWLPLLPALFGIFWGAPLLAAEYEQRTHTLAWTQSVSRGRWLTGKLGGLGLLVVLTGLAFGWMVNGWLGVFDGSGIAETFADPGLFSVSGIVPAAWWLFMFAVGTAAGAVLRRTLPAMAVTLAIFVLLLFGLMNLRSEYAAPVRAQIGAGQPEAPGAPGSPVPAGANIVGFDFVPRAGAPAPATASAACARADFYPKQVACLKYNGWDRMLQFQPAERYWRFQWTESAILGAGALATGGLTVSQAMRRRL
jgi:hypothetical protein